MAHGTRGSPGFSGQDAEGCILYACRTGLPGYLLVARRLESLNTIPSPEQSCEQGCFEAFYGVVISASQGVNFRISANHGPWFSVDFHLIFMLQYLVGPPSAAITALQRSHHESTRASIKLFGTASHASHTITLRRSKDILSGR